MKLWKYWSLYEISVLMQYTLYNIVRWRTDWFYSIWSP